jgi:hypothetical protein
VVLQDGVEAVEFGLLAAVPDRRGERIGDDDGEFVSPRADFGYVAIGAGDVAAAGPAVVDIWCDVGVAGSDAQLAGRVSGIENAGHALAVEDLQ